MYSIFVGIDIAKLSFEACLLFDGQPNHLGKFNNNEQGFKDLVSRISSLTSCERSSWFFCFENTGAYSKSIVYWLHQHEIAFREENPIKISKSLGLKRGKDDKSDAHAISIYAYRLRDAIQPSRISSKVISRLKKLLSKRTYLVKKRAAAKTNLKSHLADLDHCLISLFQEQHDVLINVYTQQIKYLEALIEQSLKESKELNKNHQLAQSVIGIGPITSASIIAVTHNYEFFQNARQFACYSGIAPFPNSSGTSIRGKNKVSHMANKRIKTLLSNAANSAIVHDRELKTYYNRKRKEGKQYGTVINAIKNKMVQRVFAVINRQTPYVPLAQYA